MSNYFDNAKNWYYTKYIKPLGFIAVMFCISFFVILCGLYVIYSTYKALSNQNHVTKIINFEYDLHEVLKIEQIKKYYHSNDVNILLYNIQTYVKNFETYEKSDNQYLRYIEKVDYMKNYSSSSVMNLLKNKFNKEYAQKLVKNGFVRVAIDDINFAFQKQSFINSLYNFLMPMPIPKQVMIKATLYIFDGNQLSKKHINIIMDVYFEKIHKQKNQEYNDIKFFVSGYRYV